MCLILKQTHYKTKFLDCRVDRACTIKNPVQKFGAIPAIVDLYPGGVLPYSLGGGVPLGSRKSYPLLDQVLQIL